MRVHRSLLSVLLLAATFSRVQADPGEIVYDNTTTYLGLQGDFKGEYGDQVNLGGEARTITSFGVEFFVKYTLFDFDETARVRIYANDGEYYSTFIDSRKPGTVLYDSGRFFVNPGFASRIF